MDTIDDDLPFIMNIFLSEAFEMLGTLVVLVISQPLLAAAFVPLAFIYRWIQACPLHSLFFLPLALFSLQVFFEASLLRLQGPCMPLPLPPVRTVCVSRFEATLLIERNNMQHALV